MVSVIVPVYKVEKYLEKCIESILAQTYKDFELILVDDGSPDNSGAICDEYAKKDSRIKVIHKENGGASSARNTGIEVAQGEFINFIDSDDIIPVDSLAKLINLQKKNNADLVCCGYELQHLNNKIEKFVFFDKFVNFCAMDNDDCNIFLSPLFHGPCFKLFRNNILKENSVVFDETVFYGEDTIFVYEYLSKCNSVQCGNEVVYNYLKNDQSTTNRGHKNIGEYMTKCARVQIDFFDKLNVSSIQLAYCKTCVILVSLAILADQLNTFYSTKKMREDVKKFYNNFAEYFVCQNKEVEIFLESLGRKKTIRTYKMLSSKCGLKKYLTYKTIQGKIIKFKAKLKKKNS